MANQTQKTTGQDSSSGGAAAEQNRAPAPRKDTPATKNNVSSASFGSNTGGAAESSGRTPTGAATAAARSLYDQAKDTAGQAYEIATEKAATKLDEKKADISGGLSTVADSVRNVAQNLKSGDGKTALTDTTAKYSGMAAEKLENVANYFENKDMRAMMRDLEGFARRNPALFIGGAAALGLLAARFFKSSNPQALQTREETFRMTPEGARPADLPSGSGTGATGSNPA